MGEPVLNNSELFKDANDNSTARERIERTYTAELVIGICAPIGSNKEVVIDSIRRQLINDYGYVEGKILRLSSYILDEFPFVDSGSVDGSEPFKNLIHKIQRGDDLRKKHKKNSILAEFAITDILNERAKEFSSSEQFAKPEDIKSRRVFYIVDSLKNNEELKLLRAVYRDMFYLFSVFSPLNEREHYLEHLKGMQDHEVKKLISTDQYEETDHGQDVRHVFTEADFFVRVSEKTLGKIDSKVERYLKLIFGHEIVTPLPQEKAMYEAQSAAGNSACLSRQVGASITDKDNTVLATGWNDVPKYGGGLYHESDLQGQDDHRCWINGRYCRSDREKDFVTDDIIEQMFGDSEVKEHLKSKEADLDLLKNRLKTVIRNETKIGNIIEFSKAVHAEMHSIINASQLAGTKMKGGKLYCTTFPCHNCARHIIAAGISEVYYIEPYPKSLVKLHYDAIVEDENSVDKVKILMYDGVSPKRYLKVFSMTQKRKGSNGIVLDVARKKIEPKYRITLQALMTLEQQALKSLETTGLLG